MSRIIKHTVRKFLSLTPYEVTRRRLPPSTFDPVRLAFAYYISQNPTRTILQIGAFDGTSGDPLSEFIRQGEIKAILVEPVEASFRLLERAYEGLCNISLVQAAIAHHDGYVTMYRAKEAGRWQDNKWVGQIASFDREHLLKHGVHQDEIEKVEVPSLTLCSLLGRFALESVDLLQVDTEGFDAEVVKMSLKLPVSPAFINFEHSHLSDRIAKGVFEELERHGYQWIHGRYDTLAIHKRVAEAWKGK